MLVLDGQSALSAANEHFLVGIVAQGPGNESDDLLPVDCEDLCREVSRTLVYSGCNDRHSQVEVW